MLVLSSPWKTVLHSAAVVRAEDNEGVLGRWDKTPHGSDHAPFQEYRLLYLIDAKGGVPLIILEASLEGGPNSPPLLYALTIK